MDNIYFLSFLTQSILILSPDFIVDFLIRQSANDGIAINDAPHIKFSTIKTLIVIRPHFTLFDEWTVIIFRWKCYDFLKVFPRFDGLVCADRPCRHMQRSIFYRGIFKCITITISISVWHTLSIAIYILQFWTTSKYLIADGYSSTTNGNRSQTAAKLESMIIDEGHAVGDGNRSQAAAIIENILANGGHAVGDGNRSQAAAPSESSLANGGHTVGDGNRSQAATIVESILTDGDHAIGDSDREQPFAILESSLADSCHAIGDSTIHTSQYQLIIACLNKGFATLTRIINRVSVFNGNGF